MIVLDDEDIFTRNDLEKVKEKSLMSYMIILDAI